MVNVNCERFKVEHKRSTPTAVDEKKREKKRIKRIASIISAYGVNLNDVKLRANLSIGASVWGLLFFALIHILSCRFAHKF